MIVRRIFPAVGLSVLLGCAAVPEYQPPALELPPGWKLEAPWRAGRPADAASKGAWWQVFDNPELDALEQKALAGSPTLALAQARLAQARAALAATAASALPQLGLSERAARQKISANRPLSNYASPNFSTVQNELSVSLTVGYELDLAGRVQQTIAGAKASAEQAAADLENTRLLLTSDLAANYFNLREIDAELDVLARAIALQRRALELVRARHDLGAASGLDLAQQQALLETTLVQLELLRRQRGQFEHALATLTGAAAAQFSLAPERRELVPPAVPLGLPSDLLQRRPDIAASERAMAAANAQIGVANAAFYPSITLGSALGLDSRELATLLDAPSLLWSLGVSAAQTLFDGGRTRANLEFASAGHAASVANYRRVVLTAMQEVQDGITGLAALERAAQQADAALLAARRVLDMTTARYEGGASAYLDVVVAQQALLASERQTVQLLGQRLVTTVFLVKALGGGWSIAQ
ncbi:MAG: efflux transporter outer membrane subunit [Rhodoferax sp.]|uniref:efflux transporter outer membrane subunit n=1 Tax=Rhodoferax sp. TaxID=50421 RepID=UPI00262052A1|nr:efflux transporter outer membrane subunit [Rhodoferax sp.]MDD5334991.1 efflux transporter outer membrane subunit [Rhodoferax sp.]